MYLNIYYDTAQQVKSIKSGSFDIGCGGYEFWNISDNIDENALFTLKYNNEKWLVYFDYYDNDIDKNSEFSKLISEKVEIVSEETKTDIFCYIDDPSFLFKEMDKDFDDGNFFVIKLDDKFISPGYLWNCDGTYDKNTYGY